MAENHSPEEASEFLHRLRHSAADVMAEAVLGVYPDAKIAIGPADRHGLLLRLRSWRRRAGPPAHLLARGSGRDRETDAADRRRQVSVRLSRGERRRSADGFSRANRTSWS